ncbi:MAG: hypothetical protein ABI359_00965 [Ginsengibacter sp.]
MKLFLILFTSLVTFNSFEQNPNSSFQKSKISSFTQDDSTLKVLYDTTNSPGQHPAYLINGQFASDGILQTSNFNAASIENINIVKKDTIVNNVKYYGIIEIKAKVNYIIKPISLAQLKLKFTDLKNSKTIFLVDNEIINTVDYSNYFVNENGILKIVVEKVRNQKEGLELNIVKLFTKSDNNIRKSKEIMIRGSKDLSLNQ